jgi:hypothetical protein
MSKGSNEFERQQTHSRDSSIDHEVHENRERNSTRQYVIKKPARMTSGKKSKAKQSGQISPTEYGYNTKSNGFINNQIEVAQDHSRSNVVN